MEGGERAAGGRGEVGDVAEPALVLEDQARGVGEIHMGLRGAVDQQLPAAAPVGVGQQQGPAAAHRLGQGLTGAAPQSSFSPRPPV